MTAFGCTHSDSIETRHACLHIIETSSRYTAYCQWFTGEGLTYAIVCAPCASNLDEARANLRSLCVSCFLHFEQESYWTEGKRGVVGLPEIAERSTSLHFAHEHVEVTNWTFGSIIAICPVRGQPASLWIALTADGTILRLDLTKSTAVAVAHLPTAPDKIDLTEEIAFHVSSDGAFAAIANTHGQYGVVVDLATGEFTQTLDRGNYRNGNCAYPLAFIDYAGRPLLVHGTDWNRLDISDPRTGHVLTERPSTVYARGTPRPAHYLDYFQCNLAASPDGEWIANCGWAWSPIGYIRMWNIRRWLEENVWESEDGSSLKEMCPREYYWNGPMCWVDNTTLGVWGYGNDVENLIPAVRLFAAETGAEQRWFPGPVGSLVYDAYLLSFDKERGTAVWDVATGERICHDPAFFPTQYHPGAHHFVTVVADGTFQLSTLTA